MDLPTYSTGSMVTDIAAPRQVNGRKYSRPSRLKNQESLWDRCSKLLPSSGLVSDWLSQPSGENLTFLRSAFQNVQAAAVSINGATWAHTLENIQEKTWDPGCFRDHDLVCLLHPSSIEGRIRELISSGGFELQISQKMHYFWKL